MEDNVFHVIGHIVVGGETDGICGMLIRHNGELYRSPLPDEDVHMRFPEGFTIGAGGSAYQTEGSWNASGNCLRLICVILFRDSFNYYQF